MSKMTRSTHFRTARDSHPHCVVCGADDPFGLELEFQEGSDGSISLTVPGGARFQGYPNRLHGGVIALLFDAAMTHCLFAQGLTGVTAVLNTRFLHPVVPEQSAVVTARVAKQKSHYYLLTGVLCQGNEAKCTAEAKFLLVAKNHQ